ncbi:MAG TPA: hypothetical protein VGE39_17375 [Prosthecobacter sp.]
MGKHFIMIGATGTLTPEKLTSLVTAVCGLGLQVRHASSHHDGDGQTVFAVGTPDDLQTDLAAIGSIVTVGAASGGAEGEAEPGPLAEVLQLLKQIDATTTTSLKEQRAFARYEKKSDLAKPARAAGKREGAAGGDAGAGKEGGDDKDKDADLQHPQEGGTTDAPTNEGGGEEKPPVNAERETPATPLG